MNDIRPKYYYKTRVGVFSIIPIREGRWEACFGDEWLGTYHSPNAAAADLLGGHTVTPSCGETADLGIPGDIGKWSTRPD